MSLMTELFVADEEGARAYDSLSPGAVQRVQLGGLTNLEFETLWAILEGEEWDAKKHGLRRVVNRGEDWVFEFPGAYVEKLRTLGASEQASAVATWAATEEIAAEPEDMAPVIGQLVALAGSAATKRLKLYLWFAL
jgi:hypothetical protein